MLKITLTLCAIAVAIASSIPSNGKSDVLVQVITPQEMDDWLKQNPQAQTITGELSQSSELMGQAREVMKYTLGARQSGDRIVAYDSGTNFWSSPQNVRLQITYPSSGTGAVITYMIIEVNQSNTSGRAYVISGGIGYRYITAVVEAQSTLWFNWAHNIYGI